MIVWNTIKKSKYRKGKKKYQATRSLYAPFTSSLLHQSLLELNHDFFSLSAKLRAEGSEKSDPRQDHHYAGWPQHPFHYSKWLWTHNGDSKLSMKKHIIKICQTAYFKLKRISSIRRFLTEDATKTLVTSYILSRLDYCNCLMGTPNSVIQSLQKILNFAARLVLLAPCHHHSTPLLEKLHWLPISEHIKYKVTCMCLPISAYLSELLHVYSPSRTLRSSSDTRMLEIQQYKHKTHGFHAFSCFGPHIWNSLPQDLRHCSTLSYFKAKLKTFLFSQYFHPN